MRILSIDVGFRNFAYCCLEIREENSKFIDIIEWNNIDLYLLDSKNMEMNILGYQLISNLNSLSKKELLEILCILISNKCTIKKFTKLDLVKYIKEIINKSNLLQSIKENDTSFYTLRVNICLSKIRSFLDLKHDLLKTIDYIIIENQPKKKNAFLGSLQTIIHSYFTFYCFENNFDSLVKNKLFRIQLIHAKHKTTTLFNDEINKKNKKRDLKSSSKEILKKQSKAFEYRQRKKSSIHLCESLMEYCDDFWKDHFVKYKKNDDLSDCFLQGLYFQKILGKLPKVQFFS